MIGPHDITVGLLGAAPSTYYNQVARIALTHITALHDLPVAPNLPSDGQGQS